MLFIHENLGYINNIERKHTEFTLCGLIGLLVDGEGARERSNQKLYMLRRGNLNGIMLCESSEQY